MFSFLIVPFRFKRGRLMNGNVATKVTVEIRLPTFSFRAKQNIYF